MPTRIRARTPCGSDCCRSIRSLALTYHARADDEGARIHSSCDYRVSLDGIDAEWWSLAVFDDDGRVIRNPAQRYAYNTATIVREIDGKAGGRAGA